MVEDDPAARDLLVRTLVAAGWKVTEAEDGIEALRVVGERRPALILLDLMMPRMNGSEFVAELRKIESWRSIPIIMMAAHDLSDAETALTSTRAFANSSRSPGTEKICYGRCLRS